jgi:hypothetical protein
MMTSILARGRRNTVIVLVSAVLILGILALVSGRLLSGRDFGLSRIASLTRWAPAIIDSPSVTNHNQGGFTNVVFLHHSTGANLIEQGGVRERFTKAGYDFWDHGYNADGLRRPDGSRADYTYIVPNDNTDPDGLANIFAQSAYGLPLNTFSGLLQHEVIVFKSCFPVSNITSDEQLTQYKSYYLSIRNTLDQHRDRVFIAMSPPPLNPAETNSQAAARARAFANWLQSEEFARAHPNVFVFNFFDYLAESNPSSPEYNMLRAAYRDGTDSHPNRLANETIAPLFVDFIITATHGYRR